MLPLLLRATLSNALFLAWLFIPVARGAENPCDPAIWQPTADPQAYRQRDDRCEGIYVQKVAGNLALAVVSFTKSFDGFDPATSPSINLRWPRFGTGTIRLRAQGLNYSIHYRMDTIRPMGQTKYSWPTNVLATLNLRKQDIGVTVRANERIDGDSRDVYLPLTLEQTAPTQQTSTYRIVVLPGEELKEIFIGIVLLGDNGAEKMWIKKDKPLGFSYYPAERPITISLPELQNSGTYRIDFGMVLAQGGSFAQHVWIYHPGQ